MPYEQLSRERIIAALELLGRFAQAEGVQLELGLYAGTALMLALNARDATKDADAIIRPSAIGHRLAAKVGAELALPADWLNETWDNLCRSMTATACCRWST